MPCETSSPGKEGDDAEPVISRSTEALAPRRAEDRAHVEAGIMPLSEYVRIYGREATE